MGKCGPEKTPYLDNFHAMIYMAYLHKTYTNLHIPQTYTKATVSTSTAFLPIFLNFEVDTLDQLAILFIQFLSGKTFSSNLNTKDETFCEKS